MAGTGTQSLADLRAKGVAAGRATIGDTGFDTGIEAIWLPIPAMPGPLCLDVVDSIPEVAPELYALLRIG